MKVLIKDKKLVVGLIELNFFHKEMVTCDSSGNQLSWCNSALLWWKCTYDPLGNELTLKHSTGYWRKKTYDGNGNQLGFMDSTGKNITY